jgi:hypothetical protein
MRILKRLSLTVAAVLFVLCFTASIYGLSKPGQYSGYSEPIYNSYVLSSHYVAGHDGTMLAIDIYRPSMNGINPVSDKLPILLANTRYQRRGDTIQFMWSMIGMENLIKHGYVVAVLDPRGAGASYGSRKGEFSKEENLDGKKIIKWLASQPWSNGRVAMFGGSYLGVTQFMIAGTDPPPLVAITPAIADIDMYKLMYPNGVMNTLFGNMLDGMTKALDLLVPAQPVDEDVDGSMMAAARLEHWNNLWTNDIFVPNMFRNSWDARLGNRPAIANSPITFRDKIEGSDVGIYQMGGWFDAFTDDQFGGFKLWGHKIIIGPWTHFELYGPDAGKILSVEHLRWYDYALKGIKNHILDEPPVYYYTTGAPADKAWRFAPDWPLSDEKRTNFYFGGGPSGTISSVNDGRLNNAAPKVTSAKDNYPVDYSVTVFGGLYDRMGRRWDGDMTESPDKRGLTYTTSPLGSDVEVTGHPAAHLWVTSTAKDGYFLLYLEEVDQAGVSHYVSDGVIRASHRALSSQSPWDEMGVPYHRSYIRDYAELPNHPVELVFNLFPISHVFHKGNRMRVTITCSDQNTYIFPEGLRIDPPPTVSVYRDAKHPSFITLPVISQKARLFEGTAKIKTSTGTYEGPAELYTFETALYLNFGDEWIKWKTTENWQHGSVEHYKGEGKLGKLSVLIQMNDHACFDALATGQGVHFKGNAK